VTFQVSPALNGYDAPRVVHFYEELLGNIRAIPGVKSAGLASVPVLHGDEWDSTMSVEGHPPKDGEDMQAFMNAVSPGYFGTVGVRFAEGRDFDRRDVRQDATVVIVNQRFARHFFGERSAVGRHLGFGGGPKAKLNLEIVGVVEDSLYEGPREGVRRQAFVPNWGKGGVAFYVRAGLGSASAYGALRKEVQKLDPAMPVFEMKTLGAQLDQTLLTERLIALLSAGFGLLATLLASIGLYGVMAFVVVRRTTEVGVRMALGASPGSVLWLIMKEVLVLLAIGLVIGIPASLGLGRFVSAQLYGIKAGDPGLAGFTTAVLILVTSAAGLIPAHRASRIDPIMALRYE
jgi:predicted permease